MATLRFAIILCQYLTGQRTEWIERREDGSTVMAYNQEAIDQMDPEKCSMQLKMI